MYIQIHIYMVFGVLTGSQLLASASSGRCRGRRPGRRARPPECQSLSRCPRPSVFLGLWYMYVYIYGIYIYVYIHGIYIYMVYVHVYVCMHIQIHVYICI